MGRSAFRGITGVSVSTQAAVALGVGLRADLEGNKEAGEIGWQRGVQVHSLVGLRVNEDEVRRVQKIALKLQAVVPLHGRACKNAMRRSIKKVADDGMAE